MNHVHSFHPGNHPQGTQTEEASYETPKNHRLERDNPRKPQVLWRTAMERDVNPRKPQVARLQPAQDATMKLPAYYAIRHVGEKTRWVNFQPEVASSPVAALEWVANRWLSLSTTFCAGCLVNRLQANEFLNTSGLDKRYEPFKVSLNAKRHTGAI